MGTITVEYTFDSFPREKKLSGLMRASITIFIIDDAEYGNTYRIKAQRSNLGLGVMCALDGYPSYQADRIDATGITISEIVNDIAGGKVA